MQTTKGKGLREKILETIIDNLSFPFGDNDLRKILFMRYIRPEVSDEILKVITKAIMKVRPKKIGDDWSGYYDYKVGHNYALHEFSEAIKQILK